MITQNIGSKPKLGEHVDAMNDAQQHLGDRHDWKFSNNVTKSKLSSA